MTATIVELATIVENQIKDKRDNVTAWPAKSKWSSSPGFVLEEFNVARSWMPMTELEEMPTGGQCWICMLAEDDMPSQSRTNTTRKEIPVQIAFQKVVDHDDLTVMDSLAEMVEQLREVCRLEVDPDASSFSWIRNEALKDSNDVPFSYAGLREGGFFEAYFTAFFNYVLP